MPSCRAFRHALSLCMATVAILFASLSGNANAVAAVPGPGLMITSDASPTVFSPEHNGSAAPDRYTLAVTNTGGGPTDGTPLTVKDTLPAGLTVSSMTGHSQTGQQLSCTLASISCEYEGVLRPGERIEIQVLVTVAPGAGGVETNTAAVSGGAAAPALTSEATQIGTAARSLAEPFGLSRFTFAVNGLDGATDPQAGDHPYESVVSFHLNEVDAPGGQRLVAGGFDGGEGSVKDFVVDLPPGLLGNPEAIAKCPQIDVTVNKCPAASQIGVVTLFRNGTPETAIPIFNMIPDTGFPAQFAFSVAQGNVLVSMYATVVPETNYGVRVTVPDVPATGEVSGSTVTFFGTPAADPSYENHNNVSAGPAPLAFLQDPVDCSARPLTARISFDSWQHQGRTLADGAPDLSEPNWGTRTTTVFPAMSGCELLQFNPSLSVLPEISQADEPTGVTVNMGVPQAPLLAGSLPTPELEQATVTLPAGLSISPSAADGLQGCAQVQIALLSSSRGECPLRSQIATALVTTPLLSKPLEGAVFLADPGCDPCSAADAYDGNMFRLFLEVAGSGVVIKKEGIVYVNTTTGQLTTTFSGLPQEPVSHIELRFKGGLRAALATPQSCGTFTSTSELTPWSAPITPDATPLSSFTLSWDGAGAACPANPPFSPFFEAGTSNPNAGQLSPLTVSFHREDREQNLAGVRVAMPPGLLGSLAGIPLCGEPQADLGTCPAASRIGSMNVAAGAGGHPFYEQGRLYLTGPYKGAPFGLSIVVPTVAGPFNLGDVVVRARVDVDVHSAALTVTSDPFPQIIDGIPLRLRLANVTVDRPGFIFNPTSCARQAIEATITGAQGAVAHQSVPFAVSGCAGLPFGPKFTASTAGHTSRVSGASLDVRLAFPKGAQSNIARVKVSLPKQLPSRLTTIQKACPDSTFAANPAACSNGSLIGAARAITPVLPVALNGPVYLVSHGGGAFPDIVIVLQGYGVRIDLVGAVFVSKKGITSTTLQNVPDVPVSSFELYLPQGSRSALAANGNLCTQKLAMPTSFIAQDGAQLTQNTTIVPTGCPKSRLKKAKKASKAHNARHARRVHRASVDHTGSGR